MPKSEASGNDALDDCGLRDLAEHLRGLSKTDSRPDQFHCRSEELTRRDAKRLSPFNGPRNWHKTVKCLIREVERCQRCLCKRVPRDEKCEALLRTVMSPLDSAATDLGGRIETEEQRRLACSLAGVDWKLQRLSDELATDLQDAIVVAAKQEQRLLEAAERLEAGSGDAGTTATDGTDGVYLTVTQAAQEAAREYPKDSSKNEGYWKRVISEACTTYQEDFSNGVPPALRRGIVSKGRGRERRMRRNDLIMWLYKRPEHLKHDPAVEEAQRRAHEEAKRPPSM